MIEPIKALTVWVVQYCDGPYGSTDDCVSIWASEEAANKEAARLNAEEDAAVARCRLDLGQPPLDPEIAKLIACDDYAVRAMPVLVGRIDADPGSTPRD